MELGHQYCSKSRLEHLRQELNTKNCLIKMTKRASLFLLTNYQIDKLASYLINRLATISNYFQLLKVDSMHSLPGFSSVEPYSTRPKKTTRYFVPLRFIICQFDGINWNLAALKILVNLGIIKGKFSVGFELSTIWNERNIGQQEPHLFLFIRKSSKG